MRFVDQGTGAKLLQINNDGDLQADMEIMLGVAPQLGAQDSSSRSCVQWDAGAGRPSRTAPNSVPPVQQVFLTSICTPRKARLMVGPSIRR